MRKMKSVLVAALLVFSVQVFLSPVYAETPQEKKEPEKVTSEKRNFLDLTEDQKNKLEELRKAQRESMVMFKEKVNILGKELRELSKDPQANAEKIEKLRDEMFNLRIDRMKKSYLHQKEIRKVYTPDQLQKMSKLRMKRSIRRGFDQRFRGRTGVMRGRRQGLRGMRFPFDRIRNLRSPSRLFKNRWRR